MNRNKEGIPGRAHKYRRGQVLICLTLPLTVLLGMAAMIVDFSIIYYDQAMLNASTQAAVLAGAQAMTQSGATLATVSATVTTYSSKSGDDNASPILSGASIMSGYPKLLCLTTLQTVYGIQCYGPSSSNAVRVAQQVTVPLFFLRILGANSVTVTSVATAAMRGATSIPYNVAIIVDTTQSMKDNDSDSNCSSTRISCALAGVKILLQGLAPCQINEASCGTVTNGNVANGVDRVSLYTFPAVTTATAVDDYNCLGTLPTAVAYATPFPNSSTYQIVNFSTDYRTSDTATSLNNSSNIVKAVAGTSGTPCMGVKGGFGTYYAQVIYAAQAALVAERSSYPNSQNVMILLSDGDATATCTNSSGGKCTAGDMIGANTSVATYPSTLQECHQAVAAAQAAASAGTRVYAVAYGAEASGCGSDTAPAITPCQTMEQIASSSGYFFSDYAATGGDSSCISASQPVTALSQIFQIISTDLTSPKLIPNNTT